MINRGFKLAPKSGFFFINSSGVGVDRSVVAYDMETFEPRMEADAVVKTQGDGDGVRLRRERTCVMV